MPWVRIDDHTDELPKIAEVGPLGFSLWVAGLAYCNRNLTDGAIPRRVAHTLMCFEGITDNGEEVTGGKVAAMLVEAGMWERTADGYQVHDYLEYQESRARILEKREEAKLRMQHGRNAQRSSQEVRANIVRSSLPPTPTPTPTPLPTPTPENGANAPRPRRAKPPVPAAVEVARHAMNRYPPKAWYERIADAVGDEPDALERWRALCVSWVGRGYNPQNVEGLLDAWHAGGLASRKGPNGAHANADPPQIILTGTDSGFAYGEIDRWRAEQAAKRREQEAATCAV